MALIIKQLWTHFTQKPPQIEADLSGATVVITGSNIGLGYEAAKHVARSNAARIILAVRTVSKGEEAAETLKHEIPNWKGVVDVWQLDLTNFESSIAFSKRLATLDRLDVYIANAGITAIKWRTTSDGWEEQLQVNVLANGITCLHALEKLAETAKLPENQRKPHLTIISSGLYENATFPQKDEPNLLAAMNDKDKAVQLEIYNTTKLINVHMAQGISRLKSAQDVIVNVVNPGLVRSNLRRDLPVVIAWILDWMAWPTEMGARNHLYAATRNIPSGAYISECREVSLAKHVATGKGADLQKRMFNELKEFWIRTDPTLESVLA